MYVNIGFRPLTLPFAYCCQAEGPVGDSPVTALASVHPISTTSPDLEPVLRHAIQHFNNNTDHPHLFDLKEVKRAQRQVCSFNFSCHSIAKMC